MVESLLADKIGQEPKMIDAHKRLNDLSPERQALLALLLKKKRTAAEKQTIRRTEPITDLPLSFSQRRMWFLNELQPGNPVFNTHLAAPLIGQIDAAVLERALNEVVRRHAVLRTSFRVSDGKPCQSIAPHLELKVPVIDLRCLGETARATEAQRLASDYTKRPFDLSSGPTLRVGLLRLSDEEHTMLLALHHIASDGWSMGVFVQEMTVLYRAFLNGSPSPLPELPVQYADFAIWQQNWLQGEVLQKELDYWKHQLEGAPVMLDLPTDRSRSASIFQAARQTFELSESVSASIKALSQQHRATPFMTFMAVFAALLYRYTGQNDILVGTDVANRNRLDTEGLIGFFVNQLTLRARLSEDMTFRELLDHVRDVALDAYSHEDLPIEKLVEELNPGRHLTNAPLFQVKLIYKDMSEDDLATPGQKSNTPLTESRSFQMDLIMSIGQGQRQFLCSLEYNAALFEARTIEQMVDHFKTLLDGAIADPDRRVSLLPLLTEKDKREILVEWNNTKKDYPSDRYTHELIEEEARRNPDSIAVTFKHHQITFDQLNRKANQLARRLRHLNVGPDSLVALCMNRSIHMVIAMLGVLKAGGGYVPIDPEYPSQRISLILDEIKAPVVLTQQSLMDEFSRQGGRVICLDTDSEQMSDESQENLSSELDAENLAYVIYTSGSTGKPKGVMINHRGLTNYVSWAREAYRVREAAGAPVHSSVGFDLTVTSLLVPLAAGKAVEMVSEEGGIEELEGLLRGRKGYSLVKITPSHLEGLTEMMGEREAEGSAVAYVIGGEALSWEQVERWRGRSGETRIINEYGPTEAVVGCSVYEAEMNEAGSNEAEMNETEANEAEGSIRNRGNVPIGKPIWNARMYILDERMEAVGKGVVGEIYIGGAGIARGYIGEGGMTAERFIPNPYSEAAGERLYKSGDLGRMLSDGNIEYLGRKDEQVKIRGFRIELSEIEAALALHPSIAQPLVLARQDHTADKRLVAYFSCSDHQHQQLDASELRAFLKLRLPDYMIPSAFVQLDSFPLTSNGKIDRAALPAPEPVRLDELAYQAPRSEAERILAEIWQQVLRIERVSVTDNFFELGGDSILSIQIIARAKQRGLHLTARQMFQHQTVEELAEVAGVSRTVEAEQGRVSGDVPLTPIQRWFFEQEIEDRNHFNQSVLFEVDEEVRADWIEEIVGLLVEHHDALRMRYSYQAGEWKQTNLVEEKQRVYEYLEMGEIEASLQPSAIERACEQAQESLNIQSGPMIRVVQMGLGKGRRGRLLIVIHHLVVDGVSWRVLLEEMQSGYEQKQRGEQIRLAAKTTSFKRWAEQMGKQATSEWMKEEEGYWKEEARKRVRRLPVDRAGGENTRESGRVVSAGLSKEETEELLKGVAETYHTQINEVLMAGLVEAIGEWVGERRVRVEMEGHGREEVIEGADVTRTVGWFTSVYPVVVDVEGIEGIGEELREVKEQMRRIPRKGIGYGMKRYLGGGIEEEQAAEVSFNYLGRFDQVLNKDSWLRGAGESKGSSMKEGGKRRELISVVGSVSRGELRMQWTYSEQVHERETIERVAARYMEALRRIIRESRRAEMVSYTPSDFPYAKLNQHELENILGVNSQVEDIYPLSPLQKGLLFHTIYAPESGAYMPQLKCIFRGDFNISAFKRAWQEVVDRHTILRTDFTWERLAEPLQLVRRRITVTWNEADWTQMTEAEQQESLKQYLASDLKNGFDLTKAPLMRWALIRLSEDAYQFIWTHHHLLLDGWSVPVILEEVLPLYGAFCHAEAISLPKSRPYGEYIAWLEQQNKSKAEEYWRNALKGITAPTPLPVKRETSESLSDEDAYGKREFTLPVTTTAALQSLAKRNQVTVNTVVQGAWALLLSRYSGSEDVVFGATVSGRPPHIAGIDKMVGMFINTLPVRVRVKAEEEVGEYLKQLQEEQVEQREYDYSSLVEVQGWTDVPRGTPLFDSCVVFQNYPSDERVAKQVKERNAGLRIDQFEGHTLTTYPVTLMASLTNRLKMIMLYDRRRFEDVTIETMLEHMQRALEGFLADPSIQLIDIALSTDDRREAFLADLNSQVGDESEQFDFQF